MTPTTLTLILLFPLLGAIIGYVTNKIAIRMLFRPLKAWYLPFTKIKLPFTPGIIPRQREELAQSIARMVSKKLLNEEVIIAHIRKEKVQNTLKTVISKLFSFVAIKFDRSNSLIEGIESVILSILTYPPIMENIQTTFAWLSDRFEHSKVISLIPERMQNRQRITRFIQSQVLRRGFRKIIISIKHQLQTMESENIPISQFFTPEFIQKILKAVDTWYAPAVKSLLFILNTKSIRDFLVSVARSGLFEASHYLNPLQSLFVSALGFKERIYATMPQIIDGLIRMLESELPKAHNKERFLRTAQEFIVSISESGLSDLKERYGFSAPRHIPFILIGIENFLSQNEIIENIIEQIIQWSKTHTINDITQGMQKMSWRDFLTMLADQLHEWIESPEKRRALRERVIAQLNKRSTVQFNGQTHLNAENSNIEQSAKSSKNLEILVQKTTRGTVAFIEKILPGLIENFNIHQVVVNRINSLELIKVEELLLGIIHRHLKYINMFGALLGALIGSVQVILSLLLR